MKKDRKLRKENMKNISERKSKSIFTNQKQIDRAIQAAEDQYEKWKKKRFSVMMKKQLIKKQ